MKQPEFTLFDADATAPKQCKEPDCATTDGNRCRFDELVRMDVLRPLDRRPKTCLRRYDPDTAEIPF